MQSTSRRHRTAFLLVLASAALLASAGSSAAGARQGVKAAPGEIVLLRDVSARPAYRPAPPGVALIADPAPNRELSQALGTRTNNTGELSDEDYASLASGTAGSADAAPVTTVERVTGSAINGTLGRMTGDDGSLSGSSLGQAIGGPMGTVGTTTRGIGDQVMGALAQFPLGAGPSK